MSASSPGEPLEPNLFFQSPMLDAALAHLAPDGVVTLQGVPVHRASGRYGPLPTPTPLMVWHHPYSMVGLPQITEANPQADLERLASAITGTFRGRSVLLMPRLRTDGPFWLIFRTWLEETGRRYTILQEYDRAGIRHLDRLGADLPAMTGKKSARSIRASRRKLNALGSLTHHTATAGTALDKALDAFLALEASGWKAKAGTALMSVGHDAFVRQSVSALSKQGRVRIDFTLLDNQPIAGALILRDGPAADPIWMIWKVAYDERYAAHAPGTVMLYDFTELVLDQARNAATSFTLDSLASPDSMIANRLWRQRWHLADVLVDLQPGGSTAFGSILMAERARLKAVTAAKSGRDMLRKALRKRR
ncbi:MAG: GNAT family N-acetyltransferase [Pseudomonadota bacterium]